MTMARVPGSSTYLRSAGQQSRSLARPALLPASGRRAGRRSAVVVQANLFARAVRVIQSYANQLGEKRALLLHVCCMTAGTARNAAAFGLTERAQSA